MWICDKCKDGHEQYCENDALFPLPNFNPGDIGSINGILRSSIVGGVSDTIEKLNFCSKHKISPEVEHINIKDVNKIHIGLLKSQVRYRYVIDMKSIDD